MGIKTKYKHLEEDINTLETLESTNNISEWGISKLNEYKLIREKLEVMEKPNGDIDNKSSNNDK
jgi:hypothetical protein